MIDDKIFFIGMSRAGKTSLAEKLANDLGLNFFDTDLELEKKYKMKSSEVYEKFGDKKFREIEFGILKSFEYYENAIISIGGGIIENYYAKIFLKNQKNLIFIDTDVDIIFERIEQSYSKDKVYPKFLGTVKNKLEAKLKFEKIYNRRIKIYSEIANIHFKNKSSFDESCKQLKEIILSAILQGK